MTLSWRKVKFSCDNHLLGQIYTLGIPLNPVAYEEGILWPFTCPTKKSQWNNESTADSKIHIMLIIGLDSMLNSLRLVPLNYNVTYQCVDQEANLCRFVQMIGF